MIPGGHLALRPRNLALGQQWFRRSSRPIYLHMGRCLLPFLESDESFDAPSFLQTLGAKTSCLLRWMSVATGPRNTW